MVAMSESEQKKSLFDVLDKTSFDRFIRKLKGSVYEITASEMKKLVALQDQRYAELTRLVADLGKRFNSPGGDFLLQYMTLDELAWRANVPRRKMQTLTTLGDHPLNPVCTSPATLFSRADAEQWLAERKRAR